MFTKTKISFKSLSGASLSPIKVFIFIYISKKIMAMPSVLLCEECLRPSVYLEIDFIFFFIGRKAVAVLFFPFCHYSLNAVL